MQLMQASHCLKAGNLALTGPARANQRKARPHLLMVGTALYCPCPILNRLGLIVALIV